MSAQQAGAASEHSVPRRNETQPNTPPDTKSNTRVPGTMGGRFFMEMGLKIQIQTSQPETSNSPSHSRTQRLGSLLGSSCWHTKVPTGTEPAGGRRRLGAARRGGERKRTLPERTSQKRTRNKTHAKENVGSSSLSSRGRARQLQRQPSHVGQRRFMRHRKKRPQPSPSRSTFTPFKIRFTSHLTVCAKAHKKLQAHVLVPSSYISTCVPWY